MSFLRYVLPCVVVSLVSIGCASNAPGLGNPSAVDASDSATTPKVGSACDSSAQCGSTMYCGFDTTAGCAAQGSCRANEDNGVCSPEALVTFCSCSGGTVKYCQEPSPMYTSVRLAHVGPCGDGGADGGVDGSTD